MREQFVLKPPQTPFSPGWLVPVHSLQHSWQLRYTGPRRGRPAAPATAVNSRWWPAAQPSLSNQNHRTRVNRSHKTAAMFSFFACFHLRHIVFLQHKNVFNSLIFVDRKEPEPEVIYLKHVERQAQQQMRKEEVVQRYPAPQLLTPLRQRCGTVTTFYGSGSDF